MALSDDFYRPPRGLCDMCGKRPAAYWFGQTSVALCGDQECDAKCQRKWNETVSDNNEEDRQ